MDPQEYYSKIGPGNCPHCGAPWWGHKLKIMDEHVMTDNLPYGKTPKGFVAYQFPQYRERYRCKNRKCLKQWEITFHPHLIVKLDREGNLVYP